MAKFLSGLTIGIGGCLLCLAPAFAQDTTVEVNPGLYNYHSWVSMAGQKMLDKSYEYCLTPDIAHKDLSQIVEELGGDGDCQVTNLQGQQSCRYRLRRRVVQAA